VCFTDVTAQRSAHLEALLAEATLVSVNFVANPPFSSFYLIVGFRGRNNLFLDVRDLLIIGWGILKNLGLANLSGARGNGWLGNLPLWLVGSLVVFFQTIGLG